MSVNRLQGFPAGELPFAALGAQLPVAVGGQVGIAVPTLYYNMLHDQGADVPFAEPDEKYFVRALDGATVTAAIGPDTNAPVYAAALARSAGPVVVALACRDPLMGALVGTGRSLPGTAAGNLGIGSPAGAAAAHTLIQGCFNQLTLFVQSVATAHPGRPLVLTGHGTGGYFALALRCLMNGQVARAYAFDAPAHGLRTAFPPAGSDVDDQVLEVRSVGADSRHEMEPALGRRLLVDGASFGFRQQGPLEDGPCRNTRLDRALRRLGGGTKPEPLVGPLLAVCGDAPGQTALAAGHPIRDLIRLTGTHLGQTGEIGAVLLLGEHADGSIRIGIPGAAGSSTATPSRALRFDKSGSIAVGMVPLLNLHLSQGRVWGTGTTTVLSIQPWDGGAYALEKAVDPTTGLLAGNASDITTDALLSELLGGSTLVALAPVISPAEQLVEAWRQRGAWIDTTIGISITPDLRPLMRGGILGPAKTLMGMTGSAANVVGTIVDGVCAKVGPALDTVLDVGAGGYAHSTTLQFGDAGSLLSLCTLATIVRGLDIPGAGGVAPSDLVALFVDVSSRIVGGHLGAGPDMTVAAAWQASLAATPVAGSDVRLSEVWLLADPMAPDGHAFSSALAGLTPVPSALTNLAGLLALATQSAVPVAPAGSAGIANCTVANLAPAPEASDFKGPPEVLTASVLALAGVAQTLTSFIANGLALETGNVPTSVLRHQLGNSGVTLSGGGGAIQTGTRDTILRLLVSRLLSGMAAKAEPVLQALLTRGWIDWLLMAREPRLRTAMPRLPAIYAFFDLVAEAEKSLAALPTSVLVPVKRPPVGTDAYIIGGLLYELRLIAVDLLARDGEPADIFNSFVQMVSQLPALGEQVGLPGSEIPVFPAPPGTAAQRLQQWLADTAGLSETVFGFAITNGGLAVVPPQGIKAIQSDTALGNGTAIAGILASWTALGPRETALIRWREKNAAVWFMATHDAQATQHLISALVVGRTYVVSLARRTADNRESAYTPVIEVELKTGLENARVAALKLTGLLPSTTWTGRDVAIEWRGIFPSSLIDPRTGLATTPEAYLDGYVVRVYDAATGTLLHEEPVTRKTVFTYTYERNAEDSLAAHFTSARRELLFKVAIRPVVGPELGEQSLTLSNPPPPKVQVTAEAGLGLLSIAVTPVIDDDLDAYAVWISDQSGFDPHVTAPTYRGPSPYYVQKNLTLGNWYIRAAAVDMFQPRVGLELAGLNLSDEVMVTLADITVDKVPPAVPTGLTLSSAVGFTSGGEQVVTLTATWDRNLEADFLVYEGQIQRGEDGDWTDFSLGLPANGAPSHVWRVEAGTSYSVRLRGRDRSGNASDYSDAVTIISAVDTTPPGSLSDVLADVGLRSVILRWTNPQDLDLDMVEVFRAAANDRAQALRVGSVRGSVFADQGLAPGSTWHYWLRAVDRTGNAGAWSHGGSSGLAVTILRATADDIADAQMGFAKFAQGIEPVGVVDTLPVAVGYTGPRTVMLTGDGKLYRLVANAWTAAVAAGDVAGQLVAGQIAANAITAGKIAAGAVNAAEIAANAVNAEKIAANAILANHIETNAIRAEHIQAGAVVAEHISVADLAAVSANLGTITAGSLGVNVAYAGKITAGQVEAGGVLADSIVVTGGTTLGGIRNDAAKGATDPAVRINSGQGTTINGDRITTGSIEASALKIKGRIISQVGLAITFENGNLSWTSGSITWSNAQGVQTTTAIGAGSRSNISTGQRIRLYWTVGNNTLQTTANSSVEPPTDAVILATALPQTAVLPSEQLPATEQLLLHPSDVTLAGNRVSAGRVDGSIMKTGLLEAKEIRLGAYYDGFPGIYLRNTDSYLASEVGSRAGQKTIFAYAGGKRRAQMFVNADGSEAGFEAWDGAGNVIFDSNGLGAAAVKTRNINPESATFIRSAISAIGQKAEIGIVIENLAPGESARVVVTAYGNGGVGPANLLLQVRGHGLATNWVAADENDRDGSGNYVGFENSGQGVFISAFDNLTNGTYAWNAWCSFVGDINGILPTKTAIIVMVSVR